MLSLKSSLLLTACLVAGSLALPAVAQMTIVVSDGNEARVINPAPGGAPVAPATQPAEGRAIGQPGGEGGPRVQQFDMAKYRQQMADQMKADLAATDDEWKILQPKIEKVQGLQMAAAMARFGGGRMMFGAPAANPPSDPASDLRAAVANKDTTDAQLKEKIAAVRAAQTKAKEDLAKAQSDLRDVITVRQEALLISRGILE